MGERLKGFDIMKTISAFRLFIIVGLVASGAAELWAMDVFSTPVEQIGVGTIAGIAAVIGAKLTHFV